MTQERTLVAVVVSFSSPHMVHFMVTRCSNISPHKALQHLGATIFSTLPKTSFTFATATNSHSAIELVDHGKAESGINLLGAMHSLSMENAVDSLYCALPKFSDGSVKLTALLAEHKTYAMVVLYITGPVRVTPIEIKFLPAYFV